MMWIRLMYSVNKELVIIGLGWGIFFECSVNVFIDKIKNRENI